MKTIIVPIDFSEESLTGLKLATNLSHKFPVSIQLVYVLHYSSGSKGANPEDELKYANRKFEKLLAENRSSLGNNSELQFIVKNGHVAREVVNQAHSYRDAMIVASTHGATGFREAFIGSNAFKILKLTSLPVFTIRSNSCPENFSRIVLPITSNRYTRQKVPFTAELAKLFGAEIDILKVWGKRNERGAARVKAYTLQVAAYLKAAKIPFKIDEAPGDNFAENITSFANDANADLISLSARNTNKIGLLLGNYSHQILAKAEMPVLNVTPKLLGHAGSFSTTGG